MIMYIKLFLALGRFGRKIYISVRFPFSLYTRARALAHTHTYTHKNLVAGMNFQWSNCTIVLLRQHEK